MLNNDIVVSAKFHSPMDIPHSLTENAGTGYNQDILAFLAKPVILRTDSFSAATVAGVIDAFNLPNELFSKEVYKRKLQGFLGIRGTIVLRIQLNATKFQQGRLILAYTPMHAEADFARIDSPTTVTQLPHVQIDLSTQTEATLEVPFVCNYTHFGLVSQEGEWARAYLYRYLPFRTGAGSTTCDYTIWAHMENVELVTPTANKGYIAQMAGDRLLKTKGSKRTNISTQEAEHMAQGPVSSALSKISQVATVLEGIPVLSTFAAPVAWATQIGASIASIFGWSKPTNTLVTERRNITAYQQENNCDATDNVFSLGLMSSNQVSLLPGLGGTDVDEMALSYINSVNAYWNTVTWNTTQVSGTVIANMDMIPSGYYRTGNSGLLNFTPIAFMSSLFRYYRGSLKFRFKFAKTIFHSGRLALAYVPGYNADGSTNAVNLDESAYTYREILDLRDATEYEFTVPYASVRPYLRTDQAYGKILLIVLNPLVAPDTVSTTVDLAIEVCGDHDFELYDPIPTRWAPATQGSLLAQMADDRVSTIHPHTEGTIGPSNIVARGTISSSLCVGERILSIKQLLSRACAFQTTTPSDIGNFGFRPFDMYNCVVDFPYTGTALIYSDTDYVTLFSSFYRFSRGGMCVRYQMTDVTATDGRYIVRKVNDDTANLNPSYSSTTQTCVSRVSENSSNGNTLGVLVPMYHPTHCRVNVPHTKATPLSLSVRGVEPNTNSQVLVVSNTSGNSNNGVLLRSTADDFQLGFFVGIPPMAVISEILP